MHALIVSPHRNLWASSKLTAEADAERAAREKPLIKAAKAERRRNLRQWQRAGVKIGRTYNTRSDGGRSEAARAVADLRPPTSDLRPPTADIRPAHPRRSARLHPAYALLLHAERPLTVEEVCAALPRCLPCTIKSTLCVMDRTGRAATLLVPNPKRLSGADLRGRKMIKAYYIPPLRA